MFQGQKRKTISTKLSSMPPTTKSKKAKKAKEPPKKLPYEMTEEETKAEVDAYIKAFFAPKKPPPKFVVPDKAREHWVEVLERPSKDSPRTDYDRQIIKAHIKQKRSRSSSAKSGKQVPQLGEQENQSVPPLNTGISEEMIQKACRAMGVTEAQVIQASLDMNISVAQYLGLDDTPKAELAYKYVHGEPLVKIEEVSKLPTKMWRLHNWYMDFAKDGNTWLTVDVRKEHFFRPGTMHIDLEELFQLFNQRAIDKSLVSCYCL
jgi:hypothetical protein